MAPPGQTGDRPRSERSLSRRTFLKVSGASALGLLASQPTMAALRGHAEGSSPPAQAALDPIVEKAIELEVDRDRIFRFVADEIRYEPYAGVLRGARGTLDGRAGNSADQALLLRALLDAAGIPVRFVTGALTPEDGQAIVASAAPDVATAQETIATVLRGTPRATSTPIGDLPAEAVTLMDALPALMAEVEATVEGRVDAAASRLTAALEGAGVAVEDAPTPMPDLELREHVWIQAASGPEWVDLDASVPGNAAGQRLATSQGDPVDSLPDSLRHRVDFVITTESVTGGQLALTRTIEHSAFADELAGQPIALYHERPGGLATLGLAIEAELTGVTRYQPILSIGDTALIGVPGIAFGGASAGPFGDALGDGPTTVADGESTAQWLDIAIASPDRESHVRRTIFDRVGDAAREAGPDLASLPPVDLVTIDADLTEEYAPLRVVRFLAFATGATSGDVVRRIGDAPDDIATLAVGPHLYHLGRDTMSAALGLARGVRTFLDGPNLVSYDIALHPPGVVEGPEPTTASIDLLLSSVGRSALTDAPVDVHSGILAGVLNHEAERIAAGDGIPTGLGAGDPPAAVSSVGAVFEAAEAQGVGTLVLRDASDVDLLALRPEVAARLASGLTRGRVAVVPERPVQLHGQERIGWWLFDPATGATVDVFEDGGGHALPENASLLQRIAYYGTKLICLGFAIKTIYTFAELVIGAYDGFLQSFILGLILGPIHHGLCH